MNLFAENEIVRIFRILRNYVVKGHNRHIFGSQKLVGPVATKHFIIYCVVIKVQNVYKI